MGVVFLALGAAQTLPTPDLVSQINQANKLLAQGRAADAESLAQKLLARNNRSGELFDLLGRINDAEKRYEEAERAFRRSIELEPGVAGHHAGLGVSLLQSGHRNEAAAEFKAALKIDPRNIVAAANLGEIALEEKDFQQAIKYYEGARSIRPDEPQILLGLATAYFSAGDPTKALATAAILSALPSASLPVHFSLGLLLAENKAYSQAVTEFEKDVNGGIQSPEIFLNLGQAYSHLGQYEKAKESYFQAIEMNPDDASPYLRVGADYLARGKGPHATVWLMRALKLSPGQPQVLYLLGTALVNEKYYDTAHHYLDEYVKAAPQDPKGWALLGDAYMQDMQFEKALASYQETSKLLPNLASAQYLVGYSYFLLKKLQEAKEHLSKALEIDPSYIEPRLRLGEIAYMEDQDEEATKELGPILSMHPQNTEARFILAKIYTRQKRYDEAASLLLDIVQRQPDDPRFHYQLAELYRKTGKTKEAEEELNIYNRTQQEQEFRHKFIRHSYIYVE